MTLPLQNLASSSHVTRPAISPDGTQIIFNSSSWGRDDFYSLDLKSKVVTQLTTGKGFKGWPAFSPNGSQIAYSKGPNYKGNLHLVLTDSTFKHEIELTSGDNWDFGACFSSDGETIYFSRAARLRPYSMGGKVWDDFDLYSVRRDGSNLQRLTDQRYRFVDPPGFVAADKLVFSIDIRNPAKSDREVFLLDLQSSNKVDRFDLRDGRNYYAANPNASIPGGMVVFIADRGATALHSYGEIWTSTPDAQKMKKLTLLRTELEYPFFALSGKHVYFLKGMNDSSKYDLMRCKVDGSELETIYKGIK